MPPLPRQVSAALRELESQVRYAPREARLRMIDNAERLCATLEPLAPCSHARLIEGVTGYRGDGDATLDGGETIAGLAAFVERQSALAGLREGDVPGALDVAAVLARWKVSRATLGRLRRRGLPARRVQDARGRARVVFTRESVEAFEVRHAALLARAAGYERIAPAEAARLVRRAARYARVLGWTRTRIANHLHERTGRSVEGIRALLLRAAPEVFGTTPRLDDRGRALLLRASRLGIDHGVLARRVRRSRAAVRHAIRVERARRLRTLLDGAPAERLDADSLAPDPAGPGVERDLGASGRMTLAAMLDLGARRTPSIPALERARAAAYHALRARALGAIRELDAPHPGALDIDRIETDLRWAARLKAELVRAELPLIVRTLESRLPGGLRALAPERCVVLLDEAIRAAGDAADAFDPSRGGRLAGPVGLAVDRVGARWARGGAGMGVSAARAQVLLRDGPWVQDWTRTLCAWQAWLEPPSRVRDWALAAPAEDARGVFLRARFGWGERPRTLDEVARTLGIRPTRAPIVESEALRSAGRGPIG